MSIRDAFTGNGSSLPHETEITRGTFTAALLGVVNVVMLALDIPADVQLVVLANLNPLLVVASAAGFAIWDRWYQGGNRGNPRLPK